MSHKQKIIFLVSLVYTGTEQLFFRAVNFKHNSITHGNDDYGGSFEDKEWSDGSDVSAVVIVNDNNELTNASIHGGWHKDVYLMRSFFKNSDC